MAIKISALTDLVRIFKKCKNVLSKIDITMTALNKNLWNQIQRQILHRLDLPLWKNRNKEKPRMLETHSTYAAFMDRKFQISAWFVF